MDSRLLTAFDSIYDSALDPSKVPQALQAIADCFEDKGAILLWRRDDGRFGSVVSPGVVEAQRAWEEGGWNAKDLRAIRAAERGFFLSGEPFTDRHVCTDEEIRTDPTYTEFQRQHGQAWFGAIAVSPDPLVGVLMSVHRSNMREPYSDRELDLLALLGRHIERALRLSIQLYDAGVTKIGLGEALGRVGIGVFAVESSGRLVSANPAGEAMLGDGISLLNSRLVVSTDPSSKVIAQAIADAGMARPETAISELKPILVKRRSTGRPLAVYAMPLKQSLHPVAEFLSHATALVLVADAGTSGPADPALVRDLLGLTLGEARVAALVGSGLSPREASEKLGVTEETARSVLKHVFSKTGISRQSELVSLLQRMVIR